MFDQTEIMKGLQEKSAELGLSKGDLVQLGALAIVRTPTEKIRRIIGSIRVLSC